MADAAYAIVAREPGGTEVLERRAIEMPAPGDGEILIRQTAIGVNFIDVYFRTGLYPWQVSSDLILGSEGSGVVTGVGSGVSGIAIGDRVTYSVAGGAYASHRVIPAAMAVVLPQSISDEVAAAVTLKGLTAHYLLHHSYKVEPGNTVLFHAAAGGVGLIAGQWLAAKGVTSIGTAGGPEKCALAKENGHAHVIDYRSENFVDRVKDLTEGAGVDAVYDSVGADTLMGSLDCLKTFGTLVSFGQSSGPVTDFKITDLSRGSLRLTRPTLFSFMADRAWLVGAARDLFDAITDGKLKISINNRFPLEKAADAHTALEGRKTTGSTILMP